MLLLYFTFNGAGQHYTQSLHEAAASPLSCTIANAIIKRLNRGSRQTSTLFMQIGYQDGLMQDSSKIFDTRDLSQINLVCNNITFQMCFASKLSCERSNEDDLV
jgi:hypothetical protein